MSESVAAIAVTEITRCLVQKTGVTSKVPPEYMVYYH